MNVVLYPHGGSGNHGCEAIVRTTCQITGIKDITLFSSSPQEDEKVGLHHICRVQSDHQSISRYNLEYLKAWYLQKTQKDVSAFDCLYFSPIIKAALSSDYLLSIGGDNYCYGAPAYIYLINRIVRKQHIRTILWGCSIEPDSLQGEMLEDLRGYTRIVARESITYQALIDHGLKQAVLIPDPAFQLNRVDLPLPEEFIEGNTVGINVSPMIIGYEKNQGMTLQNYIALIQYLIDETDMQIALIPHVVWSHNDDRIPLKILYDRFKETGRICMIEDHNAEELKGYIARCRFMVVARTHASIAAYSQEVPTLVVGYSVKAKGIATDLFGTDQNYVIPVQALQKKDDLTDAFGYLLKNEYNIRMHLKSFMPEYKNRVLQLKDILC